MLQKLGVFALFIVLLCILSIPHTLALESKEYLNEFSNEGESCQFVSYLNYFTQEPFLIVFSQDILTVPVLYQCCKDSHCVNIIFDLQNEEFLSTERNNELIDIFYIQSNINSGKIDEDAYMIGDAFDICEYFGVDKLQKQTVSLSAEVAEVSKPLMNTKTKQVVTEVIKTGKITGAITKLNPETFIASAVCYSNTWGLNKAYEKLTECRGYLHNIKNSVSQEGQKTQLQTCNEDAKIVLNSYIDSPISKGRYAVNTVGNAITGFFGFVKDISDNPSEIPEFKMEKTSYEESQETLSKIQDFDKLMEDPYKYSKLNEFNTRIQQKNQYANTALVIVKENLTASKKSLPNVFEVFLTNIFYEPNYNLSQIDYDLMTAETNVRQSEGSLSRYKFNSVIQESSRVYDKLGIINSNIENELSIARIWDRRWTIAFYVTGGLIIFVIVGLFILNKRNSYP